jgi:hypothetical protein
VSLILVGILGLVIIFMFALLAFGFFREWLDPLSGRHCRTAYECFITIIHHGFVEGMYTVSWSWCVCVCVCASSPSSTMALSKACTRSVGVGVCV